MIARNYRKYPEALALQLAITFYWAARRIRERHAAARSNALQHTPQPKDAEDFPVGTVVVTPTGAKAKVTGYRGYRRDHRIRLVCQYLDPVNRRFDVVQLLPELVKVVQEEKQYGT